MKTKKTTISDEEARRLIAEREAKQTALNEARRAINAHNGFMAKVVKEKEFRQDIEDKDEQEERGNRVTHASMVWGDLFPLFIFLLIALGLFSFVVLYIVPISGW